MARDLSRHHLAILLGAVACGGDDLVLPDTGAPHLLAIEQGQAQQGQVAAPLADSIVILVTDALGRPVVRLPLSANLAGGGTIAPAALRTGADGRVRFVWSLGATAGAEQLEIAAGGDNGPKVVVSATALPGPLAALDVISGDQQVGTAGNALLDSLVVRALDGYGNRLSGVLLAWQPGNGTASPDTVQTTAGGLAGTRWTLGPEVGTQTLSVHQPGSAITADFSATALAGPAPVLVMVVQPSDTAVGGQPFSRQPIVQVSDPSGAPLATPGVAITVAVSGGSALLQGTTTVATDVNGRATFTDLALNGVAGDHTLIFATVGYLSVASTPITLLALPPDPGASVVAVQPPSIPAGAQATITVTVRSASGLPVRGATVILQVSGAGNTVVQPAGPSDNNGVATGSLISTVAETKIVSATAAGIELADSVAVQVLPGPADAAQTTAKVPNGRRLRLTSITITTRDAFGNPLTTGGLAGQFTVTVTGSNSATASVSDNGDGSYQASYLPLFKGTDIITITLGGTAISGSPFSSKVS